MLRDDGADTGILAFLQSLLADALDKIELEITTKIVALTANDLDDCPVIQFGGSKFAR